MSGLAIADHWFERRTLADGITLLWEPHVHPLLRCNIWHVRGRDSDLLIDTGLGVASLADAARDLFDKPLQVVLTHTHMDHAGGAHEFPPCCVHEAEAAALAAASNHLPLDISVYSDDERAWFAAIGYDISVGLLTAIPHADFDPATYLMRPADAGPADRRGRCHRHRKRGLRGAAPARTLPWQYRSLEPEDWRVVLGRCDL